MKSEFRKGQRVMWLGVDRKSNTYHYFPKQEVEILSTDDRIGMCLIRCYIKFDEDTGLVHPKSRERWVSESKLTKLK